MDANKTKLEFFGKEGFLDVSKEVDYGQRTQYIQGINNVLDGSVYDDLIAEMNERENQKKEKKWDYCFYFQSLFLAIRLYQQTMSH